MHIRWMQFHKGFAALKLAETIWPAYWLELVASEGEHCPGVFA